MIDAEKLRVFLDKNLPKGMSVVENEMTIQAKAELHIYSSIFINPEGGRISKHKPAWWAK